MKPYPHQYLDLSIGRIKIIHNGVASKTRLLCLHGWLDNRASFLPLFPELEQYECVAVDMIGHGQSAHRDQNAMYHYTDYVRDVGLMLDALDWQQCHLVGHSMGGAIGLLSASALAERIESLTMIDALHPLTRTAEDGPAMLKQSLNQFAGWDKNRQKLFPSLRAAVAARLAASPFPQTKENAELLMRYATEETPNGYRLRSDARLTFRSPIMLNPSQIDAFITAVKQPVLLVLASRGIVQKISDLDRCLALFKNVRVEYLEGGHHIHMEQATETGQLIRSFLDQA